MKKNRVKNLGLCCLCALALMSWEAARAALDPFTGSITVNGNLGDWYNGGSDFSGGSTLKPGVGAIDDAAGFSDNPLDSGRVKGGSPLPNGFNIGRSLVAFDPYTVDGTLYVAFDLPGPDIDNAAIADPAANVVTLGPVLAFDGDGNGHATNIRFIDGLTTCAGTSGSVDMDVIVCDVDDRGFEDNSSNLAADEAYTVTIQPGPAGDPTPAVASVFRLIWNNATGKPTLQYVSGPITLANVIAAPTAEPTPNAGAWDVEFRFQNIFDVYDRCEAFEWRVISKSDSDADFSSEDSTDGRVQYRYPRAAITCKVVLVNLAGEEITGNACDPQGATPPLGVQVGTKWDVYVDVTANANNEQDVTPYTIKMAGFADVVVNTPLPKGQTRRHLVGSNQTCTVSGEQHTYTANVSGQGAITLDCFPITTTCSESIVCCGEPDICITKKVVCAPAGACPTDTNLYQDANDQASAVTGTSNSAYPAFCYEITVTNCGEEDLTGVTVVDGIAGVDAGFPASFDLKIGESITKQFKYTWTSLGYHENTATASGTGVTSGTTVNDSDPAWVRVKEIDVACEIVLNNSFDTDEVPDNNHVTLPSDSLPNTPVFVTLTVKNVAAPANGGDLKISSLSLTDCGERPLPVTLWECDPEPGAEPKPIDLSSLVGEVLKPGDSVSISGCWLVTCPGGCIKLTVNADVNPVPGECNRDANGNLITDTTDCTADVTCELPKTCRVTGGGVLTEGVEQTQCIEVAKTSFLPAIENSRGVQYITHGGQLGAPYAVEDCDPETLGNPCIRGQWEHQRHYSGKGRITKTFDINNHSANPKGIFDSLHCVCLPCCDPVSGDLIPAKLEGGLCNPDDHKICGPQPRPAPANAIIFSGLARVTTADTGNNGKKNQKWAVFRVYVEDRSEPGGYHPKGGVKPSDVYCFQAWMPTKPDGSYYMVTEHPTGEGVYEDLRKAVSQNNCDFVDGMKADPTKLGMLPPLKVSWNGKEWSADVSDIGPLDRGNHQIHPSTSATCETEIVVDPE